MEEDNLLMCGPPPAEKKTRVQQCKDFLVENPLMIVPVGAAAVYSLPLLLNLAYLTPWVYISYKIGYKIYKNISAAKKL